LGLVFAADVVGTDGAVVTVRGLPCLTTQRGVAGLFSIAKEFVTAESVVGGECARAVVFGITTVRGAVDLVVAFGLGFQAAAVQALIVDGAGIAVVAGVVVGRIGAALIGVAVIVGACVAILTFDGGVLAAHRWDACIVGAFVVVFADKGSTGLTACVDITGLGSIAGISIGAIDWHIDTAHIRVTRIGGTGVPIGTRKRDVLALAAGVAAVPGTGVSVLTVFRCVDTARSSGVARIGGARVVVVTHQRFVLTPRARAAGIHGARVVVIANDGAVRTTRAGGLAGIRCAGVAVVAGNRCVLTTRRWITSIGGAGVPVIA